MGKRLLSALLLALGACAAPVTTVYPGGADRALPLSGWTGSRPISDVPKRIFAFPETGVWISNDFEGGRVNWAWWAADSAFMAHIRPENVPIHDSPWYAFKVWSREPRTITVHLRYEGAEHRYWPVVSRGGKPGSPLDSASVRIDAVTQQASFRLKVGPDTLWVSGQELLTSEFFDRWTDSLAEQSHITRRAIGSSVRDRPIHMVDFGNPRAARHVLIIGRQHPPEVTGTVALVRFVEELAADSPIAQEFRERFRVHVVPLVNPDGVDLGHWRHNAGGVDLNRDWESFNQPETLAIRNALVAAVAGSGGKVWLALDFHSTRQDIFYTLDRTLVTDPPGITDRWLELIAARLPEYRVDDSPSGLEESSARNWFYRAFGAPTLIYEVGDDTDRGLIREVATTAAQGAMLILLEELGGEDPQPDRVVQEIMRMIGG
jgi:predicted deacylase